MKNFLSKLSGGNKKESGIPTAGEMGMASNFDGESPSSSSKPTPIQAKTLKRTPGSWFREHFGADKSVNKKQSPKILPENESTQPQVKTEDMEPHPQTNTLLISPLNIDRHEDPRDQMKLDALDIGIQVLDAFGKLADVIGLVLPDALGLALENITVILEKLKKLVENKRAWKELLIAIDNRQRSFNEQLDGVNAQDISKKLVAPICQYAEALKKLAATVMEQSGVMEKGVPADSRLVRIKHFIKQFINTDSDAQNINECKAQLAAVMGEFQFTITMYMAITLNNIDAMVNYLMTTSFLETSGSTLDGTSLVIKRRSCLEGTRVDVLEQIRDWSHSEGEGAKPVYCIQDVAGTGKSTIAYTMAKEWGIGECFMFFSSDYSKPGPGTICKLLAKQILKSCHGPGWAVHWSTTSSDLSSPITGLEDLWGKLVAEPLGKCTVHKRHLLIVDAFDECDMHTRRPLLEHMLRTCSSQSPPQLRILLTTRAQDNICGALEQERYHDGILYGHLLNSESSLTDIKLYVEYRLKDSKFDEISETQRERFVQRCQGLFIFASTACDQLEIELKEDQSAALEDILQEFTSLYAVYHRALSQAKASDRSSERLKDMLRVILVAREALSISAIADILSISLQSADTLVKRLGSVIASGTVDQPISFLHATLAEFLLQPDWIDEKDAESDSKERRLNDYHITKAEGHRVVLKGCLSKVMKEQLQFNICRLETSYLLNEELEDLGDRVENCISPGLRYSCHQWANHLKSNQFDAEIFNHLEYFMQHQFLFCLEVLSLTKQVNIGPRMLSLLIDWIQPHDQNDTLAMAADMKAFASMFAAVISQSVSHIYLSALPFSPRRSTIWQRYIQDYGRTLAIQTGGLGHWPTIQNVFVGHESRVTSVAFSPDGTSIVSGSDDRTVRIWDAVTGEAVGRPFEGHHADVNSVAFSPDGTRIVSGSTDGTVRVWDAVTGEVVAGPFRGHDLSVTSVGFSPDGTRIVSGFAHGTVRVWDAVTGEVVTGPFKGHDHSVTAVAFSPDGTRIVSGSVDNTARVWDAITGEIVTGPFEGHSNNVMSVTFSPDGTRIASGSWDRTVRVWDATTGRLVAAPFEGHHDRVNSVGFSPDGTRIVSGSDDRTVRVWDAITGETIASHFDGHLSDVNSVGFSPDGTRIVSGSNDRTVRVWDAITGGVVVRPFEGHHSDVNSVAFSPDGRRIVSGSADKTVRVWDVISGEEVAGPFTGHRLYVTSVAFSPDGTRIVSGSADETVRVWDAVTGEVVAGPFRGHDLSVTSVAFSSDGTRIVSGSADETIRVWDAITGEVVAGPFHGHDLSVTSVAFSLDGTQIVSGSADETVRVWDAVTGEVPAGPFQGHDFSVTCVAFSPDGTHIVSGSVDGTVRVWDAVTGELVTGPFGKLAAGPFEYDDVKVTGSSEATVQALEITTGAVVGIEIGILPFHGLSVAFSPDGTRIVSGSADKTIRVWDAVTGEVVMGPFQGHENAVTSVAFAQDGERVVSGSVDTTIRVWDTSADSSKAEQSSASFTCNSRMDDGWILGPQSERLFWVPPMLRSGLARPGSTLIIGTPTVTRLNMQRFVHGKMWSLCKNSGG